MKFLFGYPRRIVIEFKRYRSGDGRKPLSIPLCTRILAGKIITVVYIAKDGKEHRHKYKKGFIERIISDGRVLFPGRNV